MCPARISFIIFFLVTIVDQMFLGTARFPGKYIVLPFLPCEMANFQGGGGGVNHFHTP